MYCRAENQTFCQRCTHESLLLKRMSCSFVFQVYWAGPMSGGVMAALLYYSLLVPKDEHIGVQAEVLFCCGSTTENDSRDPLLEDVKDRWSRT